MNAFASLGSGSRGNGTLVRLGDALLLVDCGFSLRQAEARLGRLGVRPDQLTALFVTHEHRDHAGGASAFARKHGIPLHATRGTLQSLDPELEGCALRGDRPVQVDGVHVLPVTVPHDAREPVQFVFRRGDRQIGVLSDLGCATPHVVERYLGCQGLFLESNHDLGMLLGGCYPEQVKRRIAGRLGHLSNDQSRAFLEAVANAQLRVVIGHISMQNNRRDLLERAFADCARRVHSLAYSTQDEGASWTCIDQGGDLGDDRHGPIGLRAAESATERATI